MTAVIYYGAPKTSDVQTIGEAVRLMGLSLIKSTVRNIQPSGILALSSIQYNNYIDNIHVAISSAYKATPLAINEHTTYIQAENKNLSGVRPPLCRLELQGRLARSRSSRSRCYEGKVPA
jgi:hypothetical protein